MLLRKFWNSQSVKSFTQIFFFYLFKNSGKLKTETTNAAATLNISYYNLHKNHDTRFLNHGCRGLKNLLHNWPGLITGFENVLVNDCESFKDTRAKIREILIKLKLYSFLCKVAVYLEILEAVDWLALIFEKNFLMSHDISLLC